MSESAVLKTKFGNAKIDNKGYYAITSRKEGNNRKFLHRLIFEDFYQCDLKEEFPEGVLIHHLDGDKTNNEIWNLIPISRSEHAFFHGKTRKHTKKSIKKLMKIQNKTGFFRVGKSKCSKCKQGFMWKYQYPDKNGGIKIISSVDLLLLKEKIVSKNLKWDIIDIEKAKKTLENHGYSLKEFLL